MVGSVRQLSSTRIGLLGGIILDTYKGLVVQVSNSLACNGMTWGRQEDAAAN